MTSPFPRPGRRARPWLGLRLRFALVMLVSVSSVALLHQQIGDRFIRQALEEDAVEAAGATALGVARDLQEQGTPPTEAELEQLLINYQTLVPTLSSLSVAMARAGTPAVTSTTRPAPRGDLESLAARAIAQRVPAIEAARGDSSFLRLVAAPLEKNGEAYGAVVVGISTEAATRTGDRIQRTQYLLVFGAALAMTFLLDLFAKILVFSPLRSLRDTMEGSLEGERGLRAPVLRNDEIGDVATAFNQMRGRIEAFSATLEAEVNQATSALAESNVELRRSVEQLFNARRELSKSEMLAATGQMAATFAHKIGTPLALISGYVQLLLAEAVKGSESEARLRTVNEQIGRVTGIVRELMARTRTPVLHRHRIDGGALLANVARVARPSAEQKGVRIEVEAGPGALPLMADEGQLEQVFLNLITNALDAMPDGGRLTLRAGETEAGVRLEVEDTGTGIPTEVRPRIFDPLFTTKEEGRGTGLGLPIVRDVILAHGGTVSFDTEEDRGSRFVVVLPAGLGDRDPLNPPEAAA